MRTQFSFVLMAALLFAPFTAKAADFKLDTAHTQIIFRVPHMVIAEVEGRFDKFEGTFTYDESTRMLGKVDVVIQAGSIDTNEPDRDKHLRSPDFFDVAKTPTVEFHSPGAKLDDGIHGVVPGTLMIRGVTKPVRLVVEKRGLVTDPWGNRVLIFTVATETPINRKDFGIVWNKTLDAGGLFLGDEIKIEIRGQAFLQDPAAKSPR